MKKYNILLVEDDAGISGLVEEYMKEALNFVTEIDIFVDGKTALSQSYEKKYDLVITDFRLPSINGLDLIKKIRQNTLNESTPVIFMSAYFSEMETMSISVKLKNMVFMTKPFSPEGLARKVKLLLLSNSKNENQD